MKIKGDFGLNVNIYMGDEQISLSQCDNFTCKSSYVIELCQKIYNSSEEKEDETEQEKL